MDVEILHEGWITKSPPLERTGYSLFKARWRRRWFVLQQGKLPRQYVLNYYSDENKRRLKGTIPLDECEQVDIGLTAENGRRRYEYMFDIKTPKRIYFLAVDSHDEMTTWVQMVCSACGLTSTKDDENVTCNISNDTEDHNRRTNEAAELMEQGSIRQLQQVSSGALEQSADPSSNYPIQGNNSGKISISSPYIHLSSCYAGKAPPGPKTQKPSNAQVVTEQPSIGSSAKETTSNLTMPNTNLSNTVSKGTIPHTENVADCLTSSNSQHSHGLTNSLKKLRHNTGGTNTAPIVSTIEPSSIRCDNESSKMASASHYSQSAVSDLRDPRKYGSKNEEVMISDLQTNLDAGLTVLPPERPPKPAHLMNSNSVDVTSKPRHYPHSAENYANADEMQDLYISEQNNNTEIHNPETSQRFDMISEAATLPRNAQLSQGEFYQAPAVSRDLKPNRRNINSRQRSQTIGGNITASHMSAFASAMKDDHGGLYEGSLSNVSEANTFNTLGPPVVRALKPHNSDFHEGRSRFNSVDFAALNNRTLVSENLDNSRRNSVEEEQIYYYMPPVNTTSGLGGVHSNPPPLMIPATQFEHPSISYIDLDLPKLSPTTKHNPSGKISDGPSAINNPPSNINDGRPKIPGNGSESLHIPTTSSEESKTIYKEVDFAKTIALNKTKRDIESEREQAITDHSSNSSHMFSPLGGGIMGSVGSSILSNR